MDVNSFVIGYNKGKASAPAGVELNIHYSETEPPKDTSKLWVKASEPETVAISSPIEQNGFVTELEDQMSATLSSRSAARVGTNIYIFGGFAYGTRYNTIEVFDTEYGTVTTSEHVLPQAANNMGIAVVGAKIYLLGGMSSSALNTIVVFDTENDRIDTLSKTLPSKVQGTTAAAIGANIYFFGGYNGSNYTNAIYIFDTETNDIQKSSAVFSTTRSNMASAVVGDNVYLFGGYPNVSEIWVYSATNDSVRLLTTAVLPQPAEDIAAEAIGTKVYLFGGYNRSSGKKFDTVNVFDTENNSIKTLDAVLPFGASGIASAVANEKVYLFGGQKESGYSKDVLEFEPGFELADKKMDIWTDGSNNEFSLIPNTTICVNKVFVGNEKNIGKEVEAALYKDGEWKSI